MKINVLKDDELHKSFDKTNKVLVEVQVNGRKGVHRSHRWKNVAAALKDLKNGLKKKGIDPKKRVEFTKKDGTIISQESFIRDYTVNGKDNNKTLQQYIKENYKAVKNEKDDRFKEERKTDPGYVNKYSATRIPGYEAAKQKFDKSGNTTYMNKIHKMMKQSGDFQVKKVKGKDNRHRNNYVLQDPKKMKFWSGVYSTMIKEDMIRQMTKITKEKGTQEQKDIVNKFLKGHRPQKKKFDEIIKRAINEEGYLSTKEGRNGMKEYQGYMDKVIPKNAFEEDDKYIDYTKLLSIKKQENSVLEDIVIETKGEYKVVDTKNKFLSAIKKITKIDYAEFGRAAMDMLNIKVPLMLGRSNRVLGVCTRDRYTGEVMSLGLNNVLKRPDHMRNKTMIHECMHAKISYKNSSYERIEEPLVEMAALHGAKELGHSMSKDTMSSYTEYIVLLAPLLNTINMFKKDKSLTSMGGKIMKDIIENDGAIVKQIEQYYELNNNNEHLPSQNMEYYNKYLPTDKAERDKKLDKYDNILKDTCKNAGEGDLLPGMATLISALKSGSLNIATALSNPNFRDNAFILLATIMEEEGIESFEEFMK